MRQNCELPAGLRRFALALVVMAVVGALAACVELGEPEPVLTTAAGHGVETRSERLARMTRGSRGASTPDFGGVAIADEPSAVLVARQIFEQGGNAADAAAALYFALSVTYPAAAGLGGGGVCLARNAEERTVESIAFLARSPRGGGGVAIPGNVRGFALLQSRYGRRPWSTVVGPAERMAATGFPVSRAGARQLADAAPLIAASPSLNRMYAGGRELDYVTRGQMVGTLAQIRNQGVNGFYAGQTARALVDSAREAGGALSLDDLRDYAAEAAPAQMLSASFGAVAVPSGELGAGVFAAALWRDIETASPADLAEAARRTAAALGVASGLDGDFGSTAFATVDGQGGAVACAVTMNGAFGVRHAAEGTGVVLAANPQTAPHGIASAFLMPVIVTSSNGSRLFFSGAGAGAPKGSAAIQHSAKSAAAGIEAVAAALAATPADARSPAHAISCPAGEAAPCGFTAGPRGDGMGIAAAPGS